MFFNQGNKQGFDNIMNKTKVVAIYFAMTNMVCWVLILRIPGGRELMAVNINSIGRLRA
jgi:hypothetical protein